MPWTNRRVPDPANPGKTTVMRVWTGPQPKPKPAPRPKASGTSSTNTKREAKKAPAPSNADIQQAKKLAQQRAAEARAKAYRALAEKAKQARAVTAQKADQMAEQQATGFARAEALRPKGKPVDEWTLRDFKAADPSSPYLGTKQKVRDLAKDGKYKAALNLLKGDQDKSGGQYLDETEYNAVIAGFMEKYQDALGRQKQWDARIRRLVKQGRYTRALKLLDGDAYKVDAAFIKRYGPGGTQTLAVAGLDQQIRSTKDAFIARAAAEINKPGTEAYFQQQQVDSYLRDLKAQMEGKSAPKSGDDAKTLRDLKALGDFDRSGAIQRGADGHWIVTDAGRVKEYLDQVEAKVRQQQQDYLKRFQMMSRQMRADGWASRTVNGKTEWYDPAQKSLYDAAEASLKAHGEDPAKIMDALRNGTSIDRQRAFEALRKAMVGDLEAQQASRARGVSGADLSPMERYLQSSVNPHGWTFDQQRAHDNNSAQVRALEESLYQTFMGTDAPGGLDQWMASLGRTPVIGEGFRGLQMLGGGIWGLVRRAGLQVTGTTWLGGPQEPRPEDLAMARLDAKRRGLDPDAAEKKLWDDYHRARAEYQVSGHNEEAAAWNDLRATGLEAFNPGSGGFDPIKGLEAIGNYGASPTGNALADLIVTSIGDPSNVIAPLKWIGAGRAAVARAGGVRAALYSAGTLADTIKVARRFSADKDALRVFEATHDLRKRYGDGLTEEVLAQKELERLHGMGRETPEMAAETTRLSRLFSVPEPEVKQLLTTVMNKMDDLGRQMGREVLSGEDLGRLVRSAQEADARAARTIEAEKSQVKLAEDVDKGRAVVAAEREAKFSPAIAREEAKHAAAVADEARHTEALAKHYGSTATDLAGIEKDMARSRKAWVSSQREVGEAQKVADAANAEHARLAGIKGFRDGTLESQTEEAGRIAHEANQRLSAAMTAAENTYNHAWDVRSARVRESIKAREAALTRIADLRAKLGDATGVAAPTRNVVRAKSKMERTLSAYEDVRKRVAEQAEVLADSTRPDAQRQAAVAELRTAYGELRSFEDMRLDDGTTVHGRISRARQELDDARRAEGLRDLRGAASISTPAAWTQIDSEIASTLRAIDAARAAGQTAKVRELGAAVRYLRRERLRAKGRDAVAAEVDRLHGREATGYVRRNKLVAKVTSDEGAVEEGMRDLMVKYRDLPEADQPSVALSSDELTDLEHARTVLGSTEVDLSDPRLAPFAQSLDGVSLEKALAVLSYMSSDPLYEGAFRAIFGQVGKAMGKGWKPSYILELLRREHYGSSFSLTDLFEPMDQAIVGKFHARDRLIRKGSYEGATARGGGRRAPDPDPKVGTIRSRDRNLDDLMDKYDVAVEHGTTIFAYDEMRPLFRGPMMKANTSAAVLHEAEKVAKDTGRPFDEVYEEVYAKRAQYEASQWLRRFAADEVFTGASPEAIWAAFVEKNVGDDLFEASGGAGINAWQRAQIREALRTVGQIGDPDDLASVSRALGGHVRMPEGATRMLGPEEFAGTRVGIPGFVVPDDHPMVVGAQGATHLPDFSPHGVVEVTGEGVFIKQSVLDSPAGPSTVLHEWGHVLHQSDNAAQRGALDAFADAHAPGTGDPLAAAMSGAVGAGPSEFVAEMYATWAMGGRPVIERLADGTLVQRPSWAELKALFPDRAQMFADAERLFPALQPPSKMAYGLRGFNAPPFHSQAATYQWLVDNGFWSKRTGEDIRAGGRVWDIDMERQWFETRFGFSPQWTDRAYLETILDDKMLFDEYRAGAGYADNLFEVRALSAGKEGAELKDAQAFGGAENVGIRKQRTPQEVRTWMAARFKDVVSDDGGKTLKRAPWLMDPTNAAEWDPWVARKAAEEAAGGAPIPAGYIRPDEAAAFGKVVSDVTRRHLDYWASHADAAIWLPEQQMRLALDVVDELLQSKAWRKLTDRPLAAEALRAVGWIQRMTVMFSGAFAIVNDFERAIFKMPAGQALNADVALAGAVDADARMVVHSRSAINIETKGIWEARGKTGMMKVRDPRLEAKARAMGLAQAVTELPQMLGSIGEEAMQLHVARRVYMSYRDSLIAGGMDETLARVTALHEARGRVIEMFALGEDAGSVEKALNALVPFFSYNVRTATFAIKAVAAHPSIMNVFDRFGRLMESWNRDRWEEEHPGIPWDPKDPDNRKLWIKIGDNEYSVDLAQYSDVLRAGEKTFGSSGPTSVPDWVKRFIRIPHPLQQGFFALLTGQEGPWGKPEWTDFFWPADIMTAFGKVGDGKDYADMVEMLTSTLTWQRWDRVDATQKGAYWYFDLQRQGRYDAADAFLADNPAVALYLQQYDPKIRIRLDGSLSNSYFLHKPWAAREQFGSDMDLLKAIQDTFDRQIDEYWDTPWDPKLRELKMARRLAVQAFMLDHPEVSGALAHGMTMAEWTKQLGDWAVDDLVDGYFDLSDKLKPDRGDFAKGTKGDLAYTQAQIAYEATKQAYLDAHPEVAKRLAQTSNDLAAAWKEFQATQAARFAVINDLKVKRLEEKLKGNDADWDLINTLGELSQHFWDEQNADGIWVGWEAYDKEGVQVGPTGFVTRAGMKIGAMRTVKLPGVETKKLDAMTPSERKAYLAKKEKDQAYFDGMAAISAKIKAEGLDGKAAGIRFYQLLEKDPDLMREYFARHKNKKARYEANQAYIAALGPWARLAKAGKWDAAQRVWDALPAWVKDRYYNDHPERKIRAIRTQAYLGAMGRWVSLLKANEHEKADRYFRSLPVWMKERYFAKHPDQRFSLGLDSRLARKMAEYFGADDPNRVRLLREDPELRKLFATYNKDDERRAMVLAGYQLITDPWLKRVYRERFPEYFSQEAKAEERASSLVRKLRAHPELRAAWEEAVQIQTQTYIDQLRRQGVRPPKMLEAVHAQDLHRRRRRVRRQAARFSAHWASHAELRHG